MRTKKRTLNELRQTKDSHYTPPAYKQTKNEDIIEEYIRFMKNEGRISQISVINFKYYLQQNNMEIKKV